MNISLPILVLLIFPNALSSIIVSFPFLSVNRMVMIGEKCYNGLGCVALSPDWYNDKYRPYNMFPAERHIINTNFLIWKSYDNGYYMQNYVRLFLRLDYRKLKTLPLVTLPTFQKIKPEIISVTYLENYDIRRPIKLLVHDFTSNGYAKWIEALSAAFFAFPTNVTVISVDWSPGAEPPYLQAVSNARLVALEIIQFLKTCIEEIGITSYDVHGIGHGLGAHILGYVGKLCRLGRITGLDPSGPYFRNMPAQVRLDAEDAEFVEVVHTDLVSGGQGIRERLGHVDYYINGMNEQPGCLHTGIDVTKVLRDHLLPGQILPACSHRRSVKYYIESFVQPKCAFLGFACPSFEHFLNGACSNCGADNSLCSELHPFSTPKKTNNEHGFYMLTSSSAPFCVETLKISLRINAPKKDSYVKGYYNVTIPQAKHGDIYFLLNENGFIKTLKTGREEHFFVFRSTPPYLHLPVDVINLEWNPSTYRLHRVDPSLTQVVSMTLFDIRQTKQTLCPEKVNNINVTEKSTLVSCEINKRKNFKHFLNSNNITITLTY